MESAIYSIDYTATAVDKDTVKMCTKPDSGSHRFVCLSQNNATESTCHGHSLEPTHVWHKISLQSLDPGEL